MARATEGARALVGLSVAVTLLAAGLAFRASGVDGDEEDSGRIAGPPRVVLIGVPGLSWRAVIDGIREDRLPVLAGLIRGESAKGDMIASGYGSDAEILASVVTGRLPFKHGVRTVDQLDRFGRDPNPMRGTVWQWIGSHGGRVAALGFPFGSTGPEGLRPLSVKRREELDRCLASDLGIAASAARVLRTDPGRHLFVYLEGLRCWEENAHDPADATAEGYYEFLDRILGELTSSAGERTIWMLFSERGNAEGPISYRPRFPELHSWPPIGFFLAWGDGVKRSVDPHTIAPPDLAVTLAYLSGSAVSSDMDGVVLFELLDDGYYFQQRLAFRP
jgi:hypothetical protein